MKLTSKQCAAALIPPGKQETLLSDGGGLYLRLRLRSDGTVSRDWLFRFTAPGGRKGKLSLGRLTDVPLALARERAGEQRQLLSAKVDPKIHRIEQVTVAKRRAFDTMETVARAWHKEAAVLGKWSANYERKVLRMIELHLLPKLGARPLHLVSPPEVHGLLMAVAVETRETAGELRTHLKRMYAFAVRNEMIVPAANFMAVTQMDLPVYRTTNFATILKPEAVGQLLRDLKEYRGNFITKSLLEIMPLVFQRPGQVRRMSWDQIDFETGVWTCPAEIMKLRRVDKEHEQTPTHLVPLSKQALEILRNLHQVTGPSGFGFKPAARRSDATRTISENTVNSALRALGYDTRTEITGHGFRAMARTLLVERLEWNRDVVERHLAHKTREELGTSYDRTQFLTQRLAMVQAWADYLDGLRDGKTTPALRLAA